MSDEYSLRPVTPEDKALLRTIFASSWNRAFGQLALPAESKELVLHQQFESQHQSYFSQYPNAHYDLIYCGENPAGRLYVDRGAESIDLIDITLLPDFRGRGIGSEIIRDLLVEAREVRKPVTLHVEHWNFAAHRLYQRLGFSDLVDIGSHWKMKWTPS